MFIHGCKTGSKLDHFSKIAIIFNQNGRGQGVVKIRDKKITEPITQIMLISLKLVVQIVLIFFWFCQSQLPHFCDF